jgi:hypothetical protein
MIEYVGLFQHGDKDIDRDHDCAQLEKNA